MAHRVRHCYLFQLLLIVLVIVAGFSFTIHANLIHPAVPRPYILYVHAAVFAGWLVFLIVQSALVRSRRVALHRQLGWVGAIFGGLVFVVGVSAALGMARFNSRVLGRASAEADLIVPLFDMVCFVTAFALAIYWRRNPEVHRRLMLVTSCVLTAAAFGRFPISFLSTYFYLGANLLILLGAARNVVVDRKVHRVYLVALGLMVPGQTVTTYLANNPSPWWLKIAHSLVG